jgi:DNA-directed RNA polymerase specialized sigma24 family protein
LTDAQLLECFAERRDAAAFEALVRRHGPLVPGTCRRTVGDTHDAEDAF